MTKISTITTSQSSVTFTREELIKALSTALKANIPTDADVSSIWPTSGLSTITLEWSTTTGAPDEPTSPADLLSVSSSCPNEPGTRLENA